jgi:hypothetical protein
MSACSAASPELAEIPSSGILAEVVGVVMFASS